jgi:hypothetical protein
MFQASFLAGRACGGRAPAAGRLYGLARVLATSPKRDPLADRKVLESP